MLGTTGMRLNPKNVSQLIIKTERDKIRLKEKLDKLFSNNELLNNETRLTKNNFFYNLDQKTNRVDYMTLQGYSSLCQNGWSISNFNRKNLNLQNSFYKMKNFQNYDMCTILS